MKNNLFYERRKNNILLVAHRGTYGGNIIQNHLLAFKNALHHSADVVEMDVILSKDDIFYIFHYDQEKELLHKDIDIRGLYSYEIDELELHNVMGFPSGHHVCKLDDVLNELKGNLINIDRSWHYWNEIIDYLNKREHQYYLLKSYAEENLLKILEEKGNDIPYMPIVSSKKELELCMKFNINLVAIEIIFDSLDNELITNEMFDYYHKNEILTFVNAEHLSDLERHNLCSKLDDNEAIEKGFDLSWGKLIDLGFDMIQTDWPLLLRKYINSRNIK